MWQYSRICLCSEWSQFLRPSECHRPAQSREMSRKRLPGGHWMNILGKFKTQALTSCEREQQHRKGKCQRRFFQGVTGWRFQESSRSKRTALAVFLVMFVFWMVTSPFHTQMPPPCKIEGNVTETSSRGSLEECSGKVQNASTYA